MQCDRRRILRAARAGLAAALAAVALLSAAGCGESAAEKAAARMTGGHPDAGREAIRRYGCGSCHHIKGVPGAEANVGPPLDNIASRVYLAGNLTNEPAHMIAWIRDPQHLHAPTAMPNSGVTARDAKDIAAYLYTLK
jgi:cytochrome c2